MTGEDLRLTNRQRMTVRVDEDLIKLLKDIAQERGVWLSVVVEDYLRKGMEVDSNGND